MISGRELAIGIYSAWRLLLFDRDAVQYLDSTVNGFWKSFYAALVALPGLIVLRALFLTENPDLVASAGGGRIAAVFAIDYVYQWVVFPLFMIYFADGMGRSGQYTAFIVARNWSQVIQVAIILPATAFFVSSGAEDPGLETVFLIAAHIATLVYSWFIARTALEVSGPAAAFVVAIELVISVVISIFSQMLIGNA